MKPFFHEGQVEVEGVTLHLVCNFRAIDCIESVTGQPMPQIIRELFVPDPPMALAGKVLWGLLREKHEGITFDDAAAFGFGEHGAAVGVVMHDVITRAFNLGDEKAKDENPPKRRGRSRTSESAG